MFDAIFGIAQVLEALLRQRYMFVGLFVGWLLSYVYEKVTGDVVGDTVFVIAIACAAVGLILDIRRGLRRDETE